MPHPQRVTFGPANIRRVATYTVYTRQYWASPWEEEEDLHCIECNWNPAPTMPTASLVWQYGKIQQLGSDRATVVSKRTDLVDRYVKIVYQTSQNEDGTYNERIWYGVIQIMEDDLGGGVFPTVRTAIATGKQLFTAFGLEKLLADFPLTHAWIGYYDSQNSGGMLDYKIGRPLVFNESKVTHRQKNLIANMSRTNSTNWDGTTSAGPKPTRLFYTDRELSDYWNTREIVNYILTTCTPTDSADVVQVPFLLHNPGTLPDWDRPEVSMEGETAYSLLVKLMGPHNLLTWWLEVNEATVPDTVVLKVQTTTSTDITLAVGSGATIRANDKTKHIIFDRDPLTLAASLKRSNHIKYDQVVLRGARMRSVFSLTVNPEVNYRGFVRGWNTSLESEYEVGASGQAGFSALSYEEKNKWMHEVRAAPKYDDVFARFELPHNWPKLLYYTGATNEPVFPVEGEVAYVNSYGGVLPYGGAYHPNLYIEPTLPLLKGVDYSLTKVADDTVDESTGTGDGEEAPLMVWFRSRDNTTRWIAADKMGLRGEVDVAYDDEFNRFSCNVHVPPRSHAIIIKVSGEAQHMIANSDFDPVAYEISDGQFRSEWDYLASGGLDSMMITMSVKADFHVRGVYPATADLASAVTGRDVLRVKYIDAGEEFVKDYVVPGTVVGVKEDGTLLTSTGGWIPLPGTEDDVAHLTAQAKLAYSFWGRDRYVFQVDTTRMPDTDFINIGDMIVEIGDKDHTDGHRLAGLDTVVTQISIRWPLGDGAGPPPDPVFSITTDGGERDAMQTLADREVWAIRRAELDFARRAATSPASGGITGPINVVSP